MYSALSRFAAGADQTGRAAPDASGSVGVAKLGESYWAAQSARAPVAEVAVQACGFA